MKKHRFTCDGCGVHLEASLKIGVSASLEESTNLVSSCEIMSDPFRCKKCKKMLRLRLAVHILGLQEAEPLPQQPRINESLPFQQRSLLRRWDANGLLDVLEAALVQINPGQRPQLSRFVFTFLTHAEQVYPPRRAVNEAAGASDGQAVDCWAYGGITGLVIDGWLRSFLPSSVFHKKVGKILAFSGGGLIAPVAQVLRRRYENEENWIKTRFGYVVGRGELFAEIHSHRYKRNSNFWPS